ncbi:hypothetical protein cypCar_00049451, partial [Cyprinus carpio]
MTHFTAILLTTVVTTLHITVVVGVDIINGEKASKNSLQYMFSVQNNKTHECGGFLISPQYVLTAAHCASKEMTVVLGDHNISPQKNLKRFRKFIPKTFKNVKMGNDIMLLKISREAVLGEKVKTVKIPDLHYRVESNTQCLVAGWVSTKQHKDVNDLLALNVSTVDIHNCKKAWEKYKESITKLPPNIICAGGYKQNGGVCLTWIFICLGTFGADIINGKKAKKNSMLYMASVQIDGKHKCGGFLINPSYVLTAAHCDKSGNMTVILGTHNISPQGANLKRYTVQNKHKHPSYKNLKTGNDIMLLK